MWRYALLMFSLLAALPSFAQQKEDTRLKESYAVLKAILGEPDKGIPVDLLNKAVCVAVYPSVKKAAFVVGGSYGKGALMCRTGQDHNGPWSAPAMYALEGGSIGFQIGGQATDFVLLVMNEQGEDSVLKTGVKLGGDASAAAGPVGREASAETDAAMKAQILSYSRAQGVFAGVSLKGSTIRSDDDGNEHVYGKKISAADIVHGGAVNTPAGGKALVDLLQQTSPKHAS